jgi:hypothetical protein
MPMPSPNAISRFDERRSRSKRRTRRRSGGGLLSRCIVTAGVGAALRSRGATVGKLRESSADGCQ